MMLIFNTKNINNYFIHIEFIFIFIFTQQFQNKINKKCIYEFELYLIILFNKKSNKENKLVEVNKLYFKKYRKIFRFIN